MKPQIISALRKKALTSHCTYRVSAIAFDKKGEILGISRNAYGLSTRQGAGRHAERELIKRYKDLIKTIVICRSGGSGKLLPIDPCPMCKKIADKLGIKIISIVPGNRFKQK